MLQIYSTTLYFNSNNAKAADIIPVVFQIKEYWEDLYKNEDFEDFYDVINLLLERLRHRLFHLQDLPLLYLIYSLTPGGRIFARKMLKKYSYKINEDKYDNIVGLNPSIRLKLHEFGFKAKFSTKNKEIDNPFAKSYEEINRNDTFVGTEEDISENEKVEPRNDQKNIAFMVNGVDPYFSFNANRSIDGSILFPFERKLTDYEFQYDPGHFILLKIYANVSIIQKKKMTY